MFAGVEFFEIRPVALLGLDRVDELRKRPGEPDGIGGACRCDERRFRMHVEHDLRKLVAPGEDQPAEFEQACGAADRQRQVHLLRRHQVEIAAVVIGFAERPDDRQDRRTAAEQIDEFRAQHAGRTARRHIDGHVGERKRLGRIVAEVSLSRPSQSAAATVLRNGSSGGDRKDPLLAG
jgi:hypothetical protein